MSCPFLSLNCATHDSPCSFGSWGKNKKWPYFTTIQHPRCEASQQASDYIWYLISFSRRVPVRIIFSLVICWEEYCPLYVVSVIASSNHCVNTSFCRISDGMTVCKGMTAPHNIWLFDSVFVRLPHLFILLSPCVCIKLVFMFLWNGASCRPRPSKYQGWTVNEKYLFIFSTWQAVIVHLTSPVSIACTQITRSYSTARCYKTLECTLVLAPPWTQWTTLIEEGLPRVSFKLWWHLVFH